jgi:hypothetical protein
MQNGTSNTNGTKWFEVRRPANDAVKTWEVFHRVSGLQAGEYRLKRTALEACTLMDAVVDEMEELQGPPKIIQNGSWRNEQIAMYSSPAVHKLMEVSYPVRLKDRIDRAQNLPAYRLDRKCLHGKILIAVEPMTAGDTDIEPGMVARFGTQNMAELRNRPDHEQCYKLEVYEHTYRADEKEVKPTRVLVSWDELKTNWRIMPVM